MTFFGILLALAIFGAYRTRTTPPREVLYRNVQDGVLSGLHLMRIRHVDFWGNCGSARFPIGLHIKEFRRITCAPGVPYTAATSDWYAPTWDSKAGHFVDDYVAMGREEGIAAWHVQIPVTRKVARGLRLNKLSATQVCCAA